jgi:hypothetical protein
MLREIATKYRLKMRGARRLSPPVGPSFIEELTRLNIKAGVLRQKLASFCRETPFAL